MVLRPAHSTLAVMSVAIGIFRVRTISNPPASRRQTNPTDIEDGLDGTISSVRDGNAKAQIGADVLELAERHLELRDDVPICSRVGSEVTVSDEFRHGSPHAAKPAGLAKALAQSCSPEHRTGRFRRIRVLIGSGLELDEAVGGQQLREGGEAFERRDTGSKAVSPVAAGNDDSTERGQNGACVEIGDEHAFYAERRVTDATIPEPRRLAIECNRDVDLDLIAGTETLFQMISVVEPGAPCAFSADVTTTSSSGNAFSVTSGRGRLNSRAARICRRTSCEDRRSLCPSAQR